MAVATPSDPAPKILAIGIEHLQPPIKCFGWGRVPEVPNVADWDAVLMDMRGYGGAYDSLYAATQDGHLSERLFTELLKSGGKLIVVVPGARNESFSMSPRSDGSVRISNTWWSELHISFVEESGDTRSVIFPKLNRYFSHVAKWPYTMSVSASGRTMDASKYAAVVNRYNSAVAVGLRIGQDGLLIVVPPATDLSPEQGALLLVEDLCGVQVGPVPPPDWVSSYEVPGQSKLIHEIGGLTSERARIDAAVARGQAELANLQSVRGLLYESGAVLRGLVLDAFEELGASVRTRLDERMEDGIIDCDRGPAVLEIKKSSTSASKSDVRQLDEWVGKLISDGEDPKGILVVNHYAGTPPNEREAPFPDNVIDYARKARSKPLCLLTTVQLYEAICAVRAEKTKPQELLNQMYEADGPARLT
jgi:hypothetical protein